MGKQKIILCFFHNCEGVGRASFLLPLPPRRCFLFISSNGCLSGLPRKHPEQIIFSVLKGSVEKVIEIMERERPGDRSPKEKVQMQCYNNLHTIAHIFNDCPNTLLIYSLISISDSEVAREEERN